jgi:DNA-3-methyladenine glycosylase
MAQLRAGRKRLQWTNGPAKLTQALAVDKSLNGANLCRPDSPIWVEDGWLIDDAMIGCGPRIGLGKTPEPWLSKPWRFWIKDNRFVSK